MKHYSSVFAFLAAAALLIGCVEEQGTNNMPENGKEGGFAVGAVSQYETKADAGTIHRVQTDRIALSEPGDPEQVYLIETVEDMDDSFYQTELETKGTPVYTETFANKYKTGFSTLPYNGSDPYSSSSNWSSPTGENYIYKYDAFGESWPSGGPAEMMFFFAAPADLTKTADATLGYSNLSMNPSEGSISFDYSSPEKAEAQQDLLFTSRRITKDVYAKTAKVLFYHTLAGVKFKSGNAVREGTTTKDGNTVAKMTNITSIKFTNILSNGHCEVKPLKDYDGKDYDGDDSNATPDVPKSTSVSKWSWDGMEKVFDTYSITVDGLASNDGTSFPESTAFEGGNDLGQLNLNDDDFSKTFMFVPQTTSTEGGEVVLTIEYTLNGKKYRKSVNFGERTWEAGKLYTYTIQANHVGVVVIDEIDEVAQGGTGKIKTFDYIKNTGNVDEYMRVAVIGNWYDSHSYYEKGQNQIVTPWSGIDKAKTGDVVDPDEGVFQEGRFAPAPWIDGGDGYWYYPYKVKPGMNVGTPLFAQFKAGTCPMELYGSDAHLEIDIIVQAIDAAWFADATKKAKMKTYGWKMDNFQNSYGN